MNWSDYAVLGIIGVFALVGLIRGFVFSVFKIASFFIAILASIKLYPAASEYLAETPVYDNIRKAILDNLTGRYQAAVPASGQVDGSTVESVVGGLSIPAFFKQSIAGKVPGPGEFIDIQSILNSVSDEITKVIINILSLLLLFVLIRLGLFIIGLVLRGLVRLPVLKQFDRLGGLAFGAVEGLLTVYILCAILMIFNSAPQFQSIFADVDTSILAKSFYQNNILVGWMFPGS